MASGLREGKGPRSLQQQQQQSKCRKLTDRTIKQNNLESQLLKQQTKQIQREYIFTRMLRRGEMMELRNELLDIPKVQNNAPISAERKRFLREHGIRLDERLKEYDIHYFIQVLTGRGWLGHFCKKITEILFRISSYFKPYYLP